MSNHIEQVRRLEQLRNKVLDVILESAETNVYFLCKMVVEKIEFNDDVEKVLAGTLVEEIIYEIHGLKDS